MSKKISYLAVDLDREIFKDQEGREYTPGEVKKLIAEIGSPFDLTAMAARLINQFDYDFKKAREFYETKS